MILPFILPSAIEISAGRVGKERTERKLNKQQFGGVLLDLMFDPATKRKAEHRPIVRFLDKVVECAVRNPQPVTHAPWQYNQLTGYFGTLQPGAVARRKHPFQLHKRRGRARSNAT
ncbi:hypothetical protein [Bradyrhizobium genosp. A]|uniref:hypothetical protein n=1 Tax=Bradyrhizobium genosp. A TaxID=83626 RepID=UPI003CFAABF7